MVSIVLLADQERLVNLFTQPGAFPGTKIRVAGGIEDILASRSTRGPGFIFIQERLGEVSGTVIAHRLADELKGRKTRLVLLGNPEADAAAGKPASAILIDAGLPDQELLETIRELLTAPPAVRKKRQSAKKKQEPPRPAERIDREPPPPPLAESVADVVEIGTPSPSLAARPVGGTPHPPVHEPAESPFEQKLSHALKESAVPAATNREEPSTAASVSPASSSRIPKDTYRETLTSHSQIGIWPRKTKIAALIVSIIVGIAAVTIYQALRSGSPGTERVLEKEPSKPQLSTSITTLPAFIPPLTPDAAYGKANPGWERYRNRTTEFRVYRNKGVIEAIQVFDRSGQGIAPQLFSAALMEIAGSVQYVIENTDKKDTYLVEKGRLNNGKSIIIYRKGSARNAIKAFVIDLR